MPKAFVTGASRGIGAETAKALARNGWDVAIGVHDKVPRATKVADFIRSLGVSAEVIAGDITKPEERARIIDDVSNWAPELLDGLVLNAAGGLERDAEPDYAMAINRDAQVALARGFMPVMSPGSAIVYTTSHWAHLYGQVELPPFDYDPIASTKKLGEEALRGLQPELSRQWDTRLIVVTGGLVTGTFVGDHAVRRHPEFTAAQRAIGNVISAEEMGLRIAEAVMNPVLPSGHTEVVGAPLALMV
jgi:short-subunit dehydrogenase